MMPLVTECDASSAKGARVCAIFVSTRLRLVASYPTFLGISAQIQGVSVPQSDSPSSPQIHNLDNVAGMVMMAASATVTVSNVLKIIGTKVDLRVQSGTMKVQRCVQSPTQPTLSSI